MKATIFYAWQSDTPNRENRFLLKKLLEELVKEFLKDADVFPSLRDIELDHDTKGVTGSPAIAETIFRKIRQSSIFVADLTLQRFGDSKKSPNPNVLLEYGYALNTLGDERIISVMNEAYGKPDELPFDLRHKRWPITFSISADEEDYRETTKRLKDELRRAIKSILLIHAEQSSVDLGEHSDNNGLESEFAPLPGGDLRPFFIADGEVFGVTQSNPADEIHIGHGPKIYIRLVPEKRQPLLTNVEATDIVRNFLRPMAANRADSFSILRNESGAATYTHLSKEPDVALTGTQLFLTRAIWGFDSYHINPNLLRGGVVERPYIPTGALEEVVTAAWKNYISVATNQLRLSFPWQVEFGIANVKKFTLAVDPKYFALDQYAGTIVQGLVSHTVRIKEPPTDPLNAVLPFFEKIYDNAGIARPNTEPRT